MLDTTSNDALIRKVLRRLIPFLILCFLVNIIDRSNITIAKSSMNNDYPGFADYFNFGIAIFYIPYCLLELPSNLIQQRVGARRWIARIMITWGIISTCFVFISGKYSFYLLRTLLGIAEAGFFPGIILYLTYWVPREYRARASALFFLSTAFAGIIGNAMGGYMIFLAGHFNLPLRPWQWLFILEGIPSVIMGFFVLFYLTDKPKDAKWLTAEERERLDDIMARDRQQVPGAVEKSGGSHSAASFMHAMASPFTWVLALIYAMMNWAYNPVQFYMPTIFKAVLHDNRFVVFKEDVEKNAALTITPDHVVSLYSGLLSAIPYGAAAIAMLLIAGHSDRTKKRKPHLMVSCGLMAVGLCLAAFAPYIGTGVIPTVVTIVALSIAAIGWFGAFATFWAIPAQLMTGVAVAAALAIINSIGNLVGNFVGPNTIDIFHLNQQGFLLLTAGCAVVAVIVTAILPMPAVVAPKIAVTSPAVAEIR